MKVFKNEVVKSYNGKEIDVIDQDGSVKEKLTLGKVLRIILNNAPLKTQQDSINGVRLAQAIDKAEDEGESTISIEEGIHDWIKPIAEDLTPKLFRLNGNTIYLIIKEGFVKENKPKK